MPSRLRRRLSPVLAGAVFGAAVFGAAVLGAPTSGAVPVGAGNFNGFEIDGDMQGASGTDWSSAGVMPIVDDTADSGFQGSSEELRPSGWDCSTGGANPGKGNVQRVYVRPRVTASGQFLDLAWVREDPNGAVNVSFEFNQVGTAGPAPTAGNCAITRTPGDLLVSYDFSGGQQRNGQQNVTDIQLYAWSNAASGGNDGSWVDQNLASAAAVGAVNTASITDITGEQLAAGRFGEATINIGVALAGSGSCATFGVVNVRSRSSNSMTAALQDRLPTTGADLSNCASIRVEKDDDLDAPVAGASFEFSKDGLVVGTCTTDAAGACGVKDLQPGQYVVRETSAPDGYVYDGTAVPVTVATGEAATVPFTNFKVKYDLDITEGAENLVGTTRTFIVTARSDTGGGFQPLAGVTPAVALEPGSLGEIGAQTCAAGTDSSGKCTVTIASAAPGGSTVVASLSGAQPASADNLWLDYRVQVTPVTAEHPVDTEQTFTVTLRVDRGAWFGPAADETLGLDLDGAGSIVEIDGGSCTTDSAGTCLVTVTSSDAGTSVLTGIYHAEVDGTERDFPGVGRKTWIEEKDETPTTTTTQPPVTTTTTTEPPAGNPPAQGDPDVDVASVLPAGEVSPLTEPLVTPPALSPANTAELPRTGAGGIREVTLLALVMLMAGLSARVLGRRRPDAA